MNQPAVRKNKNEFSGQTAVTEDVAGLRILIANLYFIGLPNVPDKWVLVDAGVGSCAAKITEAAEIRFGKGARPQAIILTHGHFDHVGGLPELAEQWNVPVYAHQLELPFLTGRSSYPQWCDHIQNVLAILQVDFVFQL